MTRHPRRTLTVSVLAATVLAFLAADARAEDARPTTAGELRGPRINVLGRGVVDASGLGLGTSFGGEVTYRVARQVLLGGGFEIGKGERGFSSCSELALECEPTRVRAGARAELHADLDGWFDPWAGAQLGGFLVDASTWAGRTTKLGLEARAEVGLDFHAGSALTSFTLGPVLTLGYTTAYEHQRLALGLRAGFAF